MGLAIITLSGLMGIAVLMLMNREHGVMAGHAARLPHRPTSPLDEAERILAFRYAKGEVTRDEYQRMLAILRR
jgi:uncharacterized membrane protein